MCFDNGIVNPNSAIDWGVLIANQENGSPVGSISFSAAFPLPCLTRREFNGGDNVALAMNVPEIRLTGYRDGDRTVTMKKPIRVTGSSDADNTLWFQVLSVPKGWAATDAGRLKLIQLERKCRELECHKYLRAEVTMVYNVEKDVIYINRTRIVRFVRDTPESEVRAIPIVEVRVISGIVAVNDRSAWELFRGLEEEEPVEAGRQNGSAGAVEDVGGWGAKL